MRTLLIDNYDSYTYNLYQYLAEVNGELPIVYTNDGIDIHGVKALVESGQIQSIVISPGPGTPEVGTDIGVSLEVLKQLPHVPILGVCLGHQALALVHGGRVVKAPEPVHGRVSEVVHTGHPLMAGIPSGPSAGFEVVRYHSLAVDESTLPPCLEAVAWTCGGHHAVHVPTCTPLHAGSNTGTPEPSTSAKHPTSPPTPQTTSDHVKVSTQSATPIIALPNKDIAEVLPGDSLPEGAPVIMALAHRTLPHMGVQFHPESVSTRYGVALLANFRDVALEHLGIKVVPSEYHGLVHPTHRVSKPLPWPHKPSVHQPFQPGLEPTTREVASGLLMPMQVNVSWANCKVLDQVEGGSQVVFEHLFKWAPCTFWLDR